MADLYIDGAMFIRVKNNFKDIEDLLGSPAKEMKDIDSAHLGPSDLVSRANDFGDEWGYGIGQLGEFSGAAVDALEAIEKAFDEADATLADALNKAKEGS